MLLYLYTPPKKSLWIFWRLPRRYFITTRNDGKGFRLPENKVYFNEVNKEICEAI
ncbi:MAG: hypothetical protein IJ187_04430 [Neisseriaceae bacterium]|nr:hypothetical protein [Neisseriaceae bacterium]